MDYAHPYTTLCKQPADEEPVDQDREDCRQALVDCYRSALRLPAAVRIGLHSVPELMMVTTAMLVAVAEATSRADAYIEEMSLIKGAAAQTVQPLRTIAGQHGMLAQAAVVNEQGPDELLARVRAGEGVPLGAAVRGEG